MLVVVEVCDELLGWGGIGVGVVVDCVDDCVGWCICVECMG